MATAWQHAARGFANQTRVAAGGRACVLHVGPLAVIALARGQLSNTPSPETAPLLSCEDESIDEIAAFLGVGDQVAAMTAK